MSVHLLEEKVHPSETDLDGLDGDGVALKTKTNKHSTRERQKTRTKKRAHIDMGRSRHGYIPKPNILRNQPQPKIITTE